MRVHRSRKPIQTALWNARQTSNGAQMKRIGIHMTRRSLVVGLCLAVVVAVGMALGSYALVGTGDEVAVGQSDPDGASTPTVETASVPGTVVARVKDSADLDTGVMVISVPLNADWKRPGSLYGSVAKKPVQLGPKGIPGMTQDAFGGQAGILLPDGRRVLYHFWEQLADFPTEAPGDPAVENGTHLSTPTIRLCDLDSGADCLIVSGARSMAWRADGMFAYARGVEADYRYNMPYLQQVVVQKRLDGIPEVWMPSPGLYTVLQWANDSVLVRRDNEDGSGEIIALAGPDQVSTVLGAGESFLATSPDGRWILAAGSSATGTPAIQVIDWEAGSEVARLSLEGVLDPASGESITSIGGATWEGNTIVLALSPADLAVLSVGENTLAIEDVITYSYTGLRPGSAQDLLLDATASRVQFVTREGPDNDKLDRTAVITYDLTSGECLRWTVPGVQAVTRLVCNPSKPR